MNFYFLLDRLIIKILKRYFKQNIQEQLVKSCFTHTYTNVQNEDHQCQETLPDYNITYEIVKDKNIIMNFINDGHNLPSVYEILFIEHILEKISNNNGIVIVFFSQGGQIIGLIGGYITELCIYSNEESNFKFYNSIKVCLLDALRIINDQNLFYKERDDFMIKYMTKCLSSTLSKLHIESKPIDCLFYNDYGRRQNNLSRELFIRPFDLSKLCNSNFIHKSINTPIRRKVFLTFNYKYTFALNHKLIHLTNDLLDTSFLKILYYNLQLYNKSNFLIYEPISFVDFKFIVKSGLFSCFMIKNTSENTITGFLCFYRHIYSSGNYIYKYYFGFFDEKFDKTDILEFIYKWLYEKKLCDGVIIHDIYDTSMFEYYIMKYISLKSNQLFTIDNIDTSKCKSIKNGLLEF